MAKLSILAGSTSQSVTVFIQDSSATTGVGLTGLAYNTASLTAYYTFSGTSTAATAITLATLAAANSAYSSGGFKEVDATNMPGVYRLDLPNAAIAGSSGRSVVVMLKGATNMAPCVLEIELTAWNNQDSVRGGMTALANAAAGASGGLLISGSNSGTTTLGALTVTGATTMTGNVSMAAGLNITQSSSNTSALVVTGNGTGHGAVFTSGSGATGDGIQANSAATNGNGLTIDGNGTGAGLNLVAGATGNGIKCAGGSTSGAGIAVTATSGAGISSAGGGSGAGILATGGATGAGLSGVGGATSGAGIIGTGSAGNSVGIHGVGQGSAAGLRAIGGATGAGFNAVGGATSGDGIAATGTLLGHGINAQATGSGMNGIRAAANTSGAEGVRFLGIGSGSGFECRGGATGAGMTITGGATSGAGLTVSTTSGNGISITPTAGHGINIAANGTSKHGILSTGGTAGTSDGASFVAGTGGVDFRANQTGNLIGTVSTVTDLTNAPTSGDFTATMKTSITAAVPTANQNADALLDRAAGVETNRTIRQALRLMLAALTGKVSGADTTTVTIRDTNDTTNRIVATVDADGNRSAVTLDAS